MKIYLILTIFLFTSCTRAIPEAENKRDISHIPRKTEPQQVLTEEQVSINWSEEIIFSHCYHPWQEKTEKNIEDIQMLEQKIQSYNNERTDLQTMDFPYFIDEYCVSSKGEYIFVASDKKPPHIGRYDTEWDILEPAIQDFNTFAMLPSYIRLPNRNYGDNTLDSYFYKLDSWWKFGKQEKHTIAYRVNAIGITQDSYESIKIIPKTIFTKEKNRRYCSWGVTPWWKNSVCFADIEYSYNYIWNRVSEKKICTYYFDDHGMKQVLEACKIFK